MHIRATRSPAPMTANRAASTDQDCGLAVLFEATEAIAFSFSARRRSTRLLPAGIPSAFAASPQLIITSSFKEAGSRNARFLKSPTRSEFADDSLFDALFIVSELACSALESHIAQPPNHRLTRNQVNIVEDDLFSCDQCDGRFSRSDGLARHKLRVHSGQLSHACDECDERFSSHQLVIAHKRSCHSEQHPHVCIECNVRFARSDGLLRHQLRLHSAKPSHACEECNEYFTSKHHVLAHKRNAHSQDRPHACSECGDRFARSDHLYRHKRRRHDKL